MMEKEKERERRKNANETKQNATQMNHNGKGQTGRNGDVAQRKGPSNRFPKIRCFCFHLCYQKETSGSIEF